MHQRILSLLTIAFCLPCFGQGALLKNPAFLSSLSKPTASGAPSYLFQESFEGTGYENSWTEDVGTPDEDDTTPTPYHGSQSLNVQSGWRVTQNTTFTALSNAYWFAAIYLTTCPVGEVILYGDNGTTHLWSISRRSGDILRFAHGSTVADTSATFAAGAWIYIFGEYTAGSGGNGTLVAYVSSTPAKPSSAEVNITTGTATLGMTRFYIRSDEATTDINYDRLLVDDVPFQTGVAP